MQVGIWASNCTGVIVCGHQGSFKHDTQLITGMCNLDVFACSTAEAASKPAQPSKRQAPKPAARAGKGGKDDDAQGKDELEDETDSMYDDDDDDGSEGNGLEGFDSESMEAGSQGDSEQDSESDEDMFSEEGSEEEEDGLDDLMNGGSSSQEEVGVSGSGLESGEDEQASEGEEAGGSQEGGCLGDMPASGSEEPSEGNEEEELEEKDEQAAAKRSHGAGLGPGSVATANAKAVAPPAAAAAKYMPPALRAKLAAAAHESLAGAKGGEEAEQAALERRVTGLLNRLAEANMQGIAKDVVQLYSEAGRRRISDIVAAQILSACSEGPRASEQFTAVAAAFVSAVCALARAQDMAAAFLAALAERLEAARAQVDR